MRGQTGTYRSTGVKAHPRSREIERELRKFAEKGVSFSGIGYRCTQAQFADQIVSGLGSQLYGARWTPKNSFPTVHLCDTAEAALQEFLARGRRMRIPDHESLPMVMAGITVRVERLLDTTSREVAAALKPFLEAERIHWRAIQDRREAVSQAVGRILHGICFSGLIAASQGRPGARNVIVFPGKLSAAEVLSAAALESVPRIKS